MLQKKPKLCSLTHLAHTVHVALAARFAAMPKENHAAAVMSDLEHKNLKNERKKKGGRRADAASLAKTAKPPALKHEKSAMVRGV